MESEDKTSKFQRINVYNRFLPYATTCDKDADTFISHLISRFKVCLSGSEKDGIRKLDCLEISKWLMDFHKYVILFGLRVTKEDHIFLIEALFELIKIPNLEPITLEKICKVLVILLKKKYLLSREDLTLDWIPLYDLYHYWEDSSFAVRGLIRGHDELKVQIKSLIKYSRSYFSYEATQQMLDKWRPMFCPFDRAFFTAFRYLSLFLPTTQNIPPEHGYKLWFDEFFRIWKTFGNGPTWEVDMFNLWSRLALHNVGRIDWENYIEPLFVRIMAGFGLPVTYANSNVKVMGMSSSSSSTSIIAAARWIVSALSGGGKSATGEDNVQKHLDKMLLAIESYYHTANITDASDGLHNFISLLCSFYIRRVHIERYNLKWKSKTPPDKRLTDEDITHFVTKLLPITFHILYNSFSDDRRNVFNVLATLRPSLVIPKLIEKLNESAQTLTEPHRFRACISTVSAISRSLVENYPIEVINILNILLPGIDVNDIWKSFEIFVLLSDLLDMVYMIDFSNPAARDNREGITELENDLLARTGLFEDWAVSFVDQCLQVIENSSREQTRQETDQMDDTLNEEEIAADCTISDTFHKMMVKCSPSIFQLVFKKIKHHVETRILEPAVAGNILAVMCKACVTVRPVESLHFFIPHLCVKIEERLNDRVQDNMPDQELQYALTLLSEVISVRGGLPTAKTDSNPLVPHIEDICTRVLDKTLYLKQKDEYELAGGILEGLLYNLVHVRQVQRFPAQEENAPVWSREKFKWAKAGNLETYHVDWYVPGECELSSVRSILQRYLEPSLTTLTNMSRKEIELDKETTLRNIRQVYRCVYGSSELLAPIPVENEHRRPAKEIFSPSNVETIESLVIALDQNNVRLQVFQVLDNVQSFLLASSPDDTESLNALTTIYDILVLCFGLDEDDLHNNTEEQRAIKSGKEDKLIQNKKHLETVLMHRINLQHENHVWIKNFLDMDKLPRKILQNVFALSISHYGEVRSYAQDLLNKLLGRTPRESHSLILDQIIECISPLPNITHQQFKGALYILHSDSKLGFFNNWEFLARLMPALVKAQHSDKPSVVELLKEISIRCNRTYTDFLLDTIPIHDPIVSKELLTKVGTSTSSQNGIQMEDTKFTKYEDNPYFLSLENELCSLVKSGSLHWRHSQMAIGMLYTLTVPGHNPPSDVLDLWMRCLIHDDRSIRSVAIQAIESVLKAVKKKRKCVYVDSPNIQDLDHPGVRVDNEWMQYQMNINNEANFRSYWEKPYSVKPEMGFYSWSKDKVKLRTVDDIEDKIPKYFEQIILNFFSQDANVKRFVELISLEHKKGEDFFSMDKAYFFCILFETLGAQLFHILLPYLKKLVESEQESEQRASAEIIYGAIRGSRFWSYEDSQATNSELSVLMKAAFENISLETIGDWEAMLNGATNKIDPNRLRWLYEILIDERQLVGGKTVGAFKESSLLRMLNKSMTQNWKIRDLIVRVYDILRGHCNHSYNKVRHQIGKMLAALIAFDINVHPMPGIQNGLQENSISGNIIWNMSNGFPTKQAFIQEMLPKLSLNFHNPGLEGIVAQNGSMEASSEASIGGGGGGIIINNGKSRTSVKTLNASDIEMMEVDEESLMDDLSALNTPGQNVSSGVLAALNKAVNASKSTSGNIASLISDSLSSGTKEIQSSTSMTVSPSSSSSQERDPSTNILETVAVWLSEIIFTSSATVSKSYYDLLPFFCQFIGTETDQEVSQACLRALCFLSVCIVPPDVIPYVLSMVDTVLQSTSWKSKLSILEFLQVFVFTNFMSICLHEEWVEKTETLTTSMLADENANVQQKASKVLGGLIHSNFLDDQYQEKVLQKFRMKIRVKMSRKKNSGGKIRPGTKFEKSSISSLRKTLTTNKQAMAEFHSGILGLCAIVEAYPYDVPKFVPEILIELEKHLHDPQPIPKTIKKTLQEFKRTHQDNWAEHKLKFTEDQLLIMTDLLVSPNYYA